MKTKTIQLTVVFTAVVDAKRVIDPDDLYIDIDGRAGVWSKNDGCAVAPIQEYETLIAEDL